MNKNLLKKTTSKLLGFSVIVLVVAAPLFYWITHQLYVFETDETLQDHKTEFLALNKEKAIDLVSWNKFNKNIKILPSRGLLKDSIFTKECYNKKEDEWEPYRELWTPIQINGRDYVYTEAINLVEMEGMVLSIALMFLMIISVLMVGIIWISKVLSAQIWKPFYNTLNQITDFEIDKNNPPQFIENNIIEFNTLNSSIDKLIQKNTEIYINQREFIENAAHELQTPLALFQTKIDTMMQFPDFPQELSTMLESLNKDVGRLNRLNKNLLLLSKISNAEYLEKKKFVVNDYLEKHYDFFVEQAKSRNISITMELNNILKIESSRGLAEVLINNLLMNAIRHNHPNGTITIRISNNSLTVTNTSSEVALNPEKLFHRFAKTNPSGKGTGLGLAIVKKITELNQWEIRYLFSNDLHEFSVNFQEKKVE